MTDRGTSETSAGTPQYADDATPASPATDESTMHFGDELHGQPPSAGAERAANRELLPAPSVRTSSRLREVRRRR